MPKFLVIISGVSFLQYGGALGVRVFYLLISSPCTATNLVAVNCINSPKQHCCDLTVLFIWISPPHSRRCGRYLCRASQIVAPSALSYSDVILFLFVLMSSNCELLSHVKLDRKSDSVTTLGKS
jgi:hypothetical protein